MKTRITSVLLLLFLIFPASRTAADHHNEEDRPSDHSELSPAFHLGLIGEYNDWDLHLNFSGEYREESPDFYEFQSVLYYRVIPNIKAGVFYSLHKGERHDDDWIWDGEDWVWYDSTKRYEHLVGADLSPRFLLPFLPGRNWLVYGRTRYSYNFYNGDQKLLFRPELSYFHLKNRSPRWNINGAYALYFPLNFGETLIYEHGPYGNINFFLRQNLLLGLTGEYRIRYWSSSSEFRETGSEYSATEKRFSLGASLIWKIDISGKKR
ncbi:MAG: hypothetical protein PQJ58_01830 [Spirochaetales bacterium]|nr:hypothetical protein [Spirochaetales bacterium]